ncbi:MAG TPA: hypothetical protein VLX92_29650 [Kofleriaceae bacterium]|nr:hypothetical protein [Kofleriaceae bacterium]
MNKLSWFAIAVVTGVTGLAIAGPAPAAPAAMPAMPKPPSQVTDLIKSASGRWACSGTVDGASGPKFTATMTAKGDLDGMWMHDSFVGKVGEGKTAQPFKLESYTTYNPGTSKWQRTLVDSTGMVATGTSDGMKDMKEQYDLTSWSEHGEATLREHVDASDLKKGMHVWGEVSADKGKTWMPVYDMICKR